MYVHRDVVINSSKLKEHPFKNERVMEAYLIENTEVLSLDHFDTVEYVDSQINLTLENQNNESGGRIDLLLLCNRDTIAVVELKNSRLNESHLTQLEAYLSSKEQIRMKFQQNYASNFSDIVLDELNFIGVLVGDTIDVMLAKKIEVGYSFNGDIPIAAICFKRFTDDDKNVYFFSDLLFKSKKRDFTKYIFNNQTYNKRRLVLAVITEFVNSNPNKTIKELREIFPETLAPYSWSLFKRVEDIQENYMNRYFINKNEILGLKDGNIAVCNQWSLDTTYRDFLEHAKKMGFVIESV